MHPFRSSAGIRLCEPEVRRGLLLSTWRGWPWCLVPMSAIFTFVGTWNDYMGPMIYLTRDVNKTVQVGLRRFIQENSSDYHLIMAASLCSLLPVSVVFLCLQKRHRTGSSDG